MYSYSCYFYIENVRNRTKDDISDQWMVVTMVAIFVSFCPLLFLNMFSAKLDVPPSVKLICLSTVSDP